MFNLSSSEKNRLEQRAPVQAATYESIKAKIDRGINRQLEGRKELQDALREMIETKAYLKKYKTIGAFAEHEYGKSRSWVYEQIKEALPERGDLHNGLSGMDKPKTSVQKVDSGADTINKASLDEVKEEEPEKPAVHSADEVKQPEPKAHTNGQIKLKLPMDVTGCVIPQQNLGAVERADEVRAAMVCASTLKTLFEKVQNEADSLFAHVKHSGNTQTFMTGAASMCFALRDCLPEVVCPQCGGKSADCHYCFGTGWICKVKWDREWVKSNDRIKQVEVAKRAANLK